MSTAVYTLTSELHDEKAVEAATGEFIGSIGIDHVFRGGDYTDYGRHSLSIIYVQTGGTEGIFKGLLPRLLQQSHHPFYLLTSGKSNSLAASMEILSYLRQRDVKGEIIHGAPDFIATRISLLAKVEEAKRKMVGCRLGVIGKPSDWLISSHADDDVVRQRLGMELVDIPMQELLDAIAATPETAAAETSAAEAVRKAIPGAERIYAALKSVVARHRLQGFTLRCFDLLSTVRNTGCLALARLNAEGVVAGCEGDVPALLSMTIIQAVTGLSGFQANPATINPETGELLFAHCTIPLNMVERYESDTHFESGMGVGIRGCMKEGDVTIFKVSGDLSRCFIAEGTLVRNQSAPGLCRTQQVIQLADPRQATYFLTNPIGNHHIIVPGKYKSVLEEMMM